MMTGAAPDPKGDVTVDTLDERFPALETGTM